MRKILIISLLLVSGLSSFSQITPLRRSESFFGLHFDFHAGITDSLVGLRLTEGLIDTLLTRVKPDFIQVDCKGHPGVTSYPTKVKDGTHVKSFHLDPLALFRKVTKKHGVALYVHYSGVWDEAAIAKRPEWGIVDADGKASNRITSPHSTYVDELLIPQLKEIADYGVDGVWVDGDCWATAPDYSQKAKELFQVRTGAKELPKKPGDAFYEEFMSFSRELFKKYVQHYTTELHKYKPEFQVASNWAFSSIMPEPATLDVDFLSGDITPGNGVNSALFESRVLATQSKVYGKPWDLMSWSFNYIANTGIHVPKTAVNLNQEAAEIMSTGGGYQCYFTQNRDASIRPQEISTMAELARFARARQPFTQGAQAIPQIGLLYSWNSYAKTNTRVYSNAPAEPLRGVLSALMDAQYPVEVLTEYHLEKNLQQYPLIIIPEWNYLAPDFINNLMGYVNNGGNLLVIGANAVAPFRESLKATFNGQPKKELFWIQTNSGMATANDTLASVSSGPGAKSIGKLFFNNDIRYPNVIPASVSSFGKGKIAAVYFDFGRSYINLQTPQLRDFLKEVVASVFPDPLVKVNGSSLVHVTVNDLKGKLTVNLINSGGPYNSNRVMTYDELPRLPEIEVSVKTVKRPVRIMQQPENKTLPFTWSDGRAMVRVPSLHIHSVLVFE